MLTCALVALLQASPAPQVLARPDGRVQLAQGVLSGPYSTDLRDAALAFALERKTELGLAPGTTLVTTDAFSTKLGASVHLQQRVGDVAVYGATVIVTFDTARRVVRVSSTLQSGPVAGLTWSLTGAQALAAASKHVEGALLEADLTPYGGWQPYVFPFQGHLRAGYLTWVPTLKQQENWHLAIDAADGSVLFDENRVHYDNEAKVYQTSPLGLSAGVGVTPTVDVALGSFPADWDGGTLEGQHIRSFNCCPTAGCDLDAGAVAKRATGQLQTFMGVVNYDVAICDRMHRATNDPALNPNANFVYTPVDPPSLAHPGLGSPADYDEFAEVHAYHHVNKVYDYMNALSTGPFSTMKGVTPFRTKDEQLQRGTTAVWVNASDPDWANATQTATGVTCDQLARTSNAMFVQREQMQQLSVPEYAFDTDALVVYQGDQADFAYDGPVVWHEFGHGVIHATADWGYFIAIDSRSANAESQALHEGNADVISAITGNLSNIGAYVGPRTAPGTTAIRDLNNTFKCPDVLWGESHQDSMHYTGAIWEARSTLFQGTDQGRTFDQAFYAALVSFPKNVDFAQAAAIISASVGMAFPGIADAEGKMKAIFDARGVTNCSKVLDITNNLKPIEYYGIAGTVTAALDSTAIVPGPYQFKLQAPKGIKSLTVTGPYFTFSGSAVRARLLVRTGSPISFVHNGTTLTNDAEQVITPTAANNMMTGRADVAVPCGSELYFTVANASQRDRVMQNMQFSFEQADSCPKPPPPPPIVLDAPDPDLGDVVAKGCGCSAPGALPLLFLGLALLRRRRWW